MKSTVAIFDSHQTETNAVVLLAVIVPKLKADKHLNEK